MLLDVPTAIWLGIATISSLLITFSLGIAMFYYQKNVFKYHRFFAFLTVALGSVHLVFGVLLWFFGLVI
jgi:hypothetical protein